MNISYYLYKYIFFYRYIAGSYWTLVDLFFVFIWILLIRKYKVSGQKTAFMGFVVLFVTMIFSLFNQDVVAGITAGFVWILFAISFVQEFYHFLKYENK